MQGSQIHKEIWIDECHKGVRYGMKGRILLNEESEFQRITIIESHRYGKGLLLDGCWMTAEQQEKHYHECLVHPALCGAKAIQRVLVIGGGDGGTARECLMHKELATLDLVEIDPKVVEVCKKYLPSIGGSAWEDPRLKLHISDGVSWVSKCKVNSYDVILVDSSDPSGPAEGLFNETFLRNCRRILNTGGVFAMQSESPESFLQIHLDTVKLLRKVFNYADPLYGSVPMYPSGWWSWTFAAMEGHHYQNPLKKRADAISPQCKIWSEKWQKGAFEAMPAFIERALV